MKKSFMNRLMKELVVDTKNYRYSYEYSAKHGRYIVKRLAIEKLDTLAAYTDWEVIK